MKNRFVLLAIIAIVAALLALPTGAQAQSNPTYTVTINPGGTCTNTSYSYTGSTAWTNFPSPTSLTYSRSANGVLINSGTINPSIFTGSSSFGWVEGQSYPSATQPYPIQMIQTFSSGGSVFLVATWNLICSGGAVTGSVTVTLPGSAAPVLIPGPSIPSGFVLKTITCDVAVFDAPGGRPIAGAAIKSGQTWFVNPKPVKAADGREWTAIFVSSPTDGYIPTSCVS